MCRNDVLVEEGAKSGVRTVAQQETSRAVLESSLGNEGPEQLVAFVLSQLKKIVAEDSENRLNEANSNYYVLSAPNYSTDVERAALLDAARSVSTNNNCSMFLEVKT